MRPPACVRSRTDGADAAVRRYRTLQMLNYMLLTVVASGHNYVAMATAGNERAGVARILHWWLQKLSAEAFFLKKVDLF